MLHVKHSRGGGYNFTIVGAIEIDKYPVASYNAMYDENIIPQSITDYFPTIEELGEIDLIWNSSPCQDFSLAGKGAGAAEGSGTRSSLVYEAIRVIKALKPKYVVWENVKGLTTKKHRHVLDDYIERLNNIGYHSQFQILNAKDYGIPQNRERVFTVSIRNDILDNFEFPEKQELKLKLKDMLEKEVDEKYYLSTDKIDKISHWKAYQKPFEKVQGQNSIAPTLTARGAGEEHSGMITYCDALEDTTNLQEELSHINDNNKGYIETKYINFAQENGYIPEMYNPYHSREVADIAPTLTTKCGGTGSSATVLIKEEEEIKLLGAYGRNFGSKGKMQDTEGVCGTLVAAMGTGGGNVPIIKEYEELNNPIREEDNYKKYTNFYVTPRGSDGELVDGSYNRVWNEEKYCGALNLTKVIEVGKEEGSILKIRKLTPKECWRLMGFDDEDFEKASKINSNAQLYKQAGNSVVVNVIEAIFDNLLIEYQKEEEN